jgi:hypothetical protein
MNQEYGNKYGFDSSPADYPWPCFSQELVQPCQRIMIGQRHTPHHNKSCYRFPIGSSDYKYVDPAAEMGSRYLPHQSESLLIG